MSNESFLPLITYRLMDGVLSHTDYWVSDKIKLLCNVSNTSFQSFGGGIGECPEVYQ